jgi:hypothetical protein
MSSVSWLNRGLIGRIRRNHGMEHATLHVLTEKHAGKHFFGHSDWTGFRIVGVVPTEAVESAAQEALQRLRQGEHHLAVHPNCGTNFVASGTLAGISAALVMSGSGPRWRDKFERLATAAVLATVVLIFSQPLGLLLQAKWTTSAEPGNMVIDKVVSTRRGDLNYHHVITRG